MNHDLVSEIVKNIKGNLLRSLGKTLEEATASDLYKAVALTLRDSIMSQWLSTNSAIEKQKVKKLYYLSVEFLLGRALKNNLLNTLQTEEYTEALQQLGISLSKIEEKEKDPALGNGGLGRLAACFLDSLTTLSFPAMGCGIRYEYGFFKQKIMDGGQVEAPDNWLEDGNMWEVERPEDMVEVHFGGEVTEIWEKDQLHISHTGYHTVQAIPYDMPVTGYDSKVVNTLRLWSARSPKNIDMYSFSRGAYIQSMAEKELAEVISKVLYPGDSHYEGKELRLKQHYFFSSATIQHIIREFKKSCSDFTKLPDKVVIHINDTHPSLAIPELMRILLDEEGLSWDSAWDISRKVFAYTNHTVMSEALEKWPVDLFKKQLPRIFSIISAINEYYCKRLWSFYPGQWEKISNMAIIGYGEIRMANLCVALSSHVNGVSQLHGSILKRDLFKDYFVIEPAKFSGITNGITHRRWLMSANPELASLITETIGESWKREPVRLNELVPYASDEAFGQKFETVKHANKVRLSNWLKKNRQISVDPHSIFDVQTKRLHEYKRQLLNVLHILYLYDRIVNEPGFDMYPMTFIFAAKAPPTYEMAKLIIRLISGVIELINRTPEAKSKLNVVFVENYGVSLAELIIPAADISEQLSTAGKEGSGTSNMKFMMNGAVTLGTFDGANIEMFQLLGPENMFLFGHTPEEVDQLVKSKSYNPGYIYERDPIIRRVLDYLINGQLSPNDHSLFKDIYHSLLFGEYGNADRYLVLEDFESYRTAHAETYAAYLDRKRFLKMAVMNTAKSGVFSSDRTVNEYNKNIWYLKPLKV